MSEKESYKDLEMVVFDMAGTTLQIGGLIPVAFKEGFLGEGIELTDEDLINANKAVDILNKYGDQAFETYGTRLGLRDGGLATMEYMTRPLNAQR